MACMGVQTGKHTLPRRGTLRRRMLLRMLRPEGLIGAEAIRDKLTRSSGCFAQTRSHFEDRCGFHIICWPVTSLVPRHGPPRLAYRIIGRWVDGGDKYLDYLARKIKEEK